MDHKEKMHNRVNERFEVVKKRVQKLHYQIDQGVIGGEEGREWLEQFAKEGVGVNLCCGDFAIGNSIGIDIDSQKIASDYWSFIDRFQIDLGPLDYIVSNYIECLDNPVGVLKEWLDKLKPGGVIALVVCNSDEYTTTLGPMANPRRKFCYNQNTLSFILRKVGFITERFEKEGTELRVLARKPC